MQWQVRALSAALFAVSLQAPQGGTVQLTAGAHLRRGS